MAGGICAATTRSCSSEWRSDGGQPVDVSYHWLSRARTTIEFDGLHSDRSGEGRRGLVQRGGLACHTVRIDVR